MDRAEEDDLKELLVLAERGVEVLPEELPYRLLGLGPYSILYRGDALELHTSLVTRFCRSALSDGGQSPESVAELIDQFVQSAATIGEQAALQRLKAELRRPLERWTFIQSTPFIMNVVDYIVIGACTIAQSLDAADPDISAVHDIQPQNQRIPPPFIFTSVEARDLSSARILSVERFGWAESVAALLTGWAPPLDGPHLIVTREEMSFSSGKHVPQVIRAVYPDGTLWSGYSELALALGEPESARSDWSKRTLAAARWYREAATTHWPSSKITASMSALESILILPSETNEKKEPLAKRLTAIARLKELTERKQIRWLKDLYDRRSEALHAAKFHENEIDAVSLQLLTRSAVYWALGHLIPDHRNDGGGSCSTIAEVLGHS